MWPFRNAQQRKEAERKRGYDYAAGCLVRGISTLELESEISAIDYNDFDRGIQDALFDWARRGRRPNRRLT